MRKGQAEFIVILGVVIIAVVAILLATNKPSTAPVSLEGKSVRDSLENLIRSGAAETLRGLSLYGGYQTSQQGTIFLGKSISPWQTGAATTPDVEANFEQMLEKYINTNKNSFVAGLEGVTVGKASVKASFLNSKITLHVTLPATQDNRPIPSKYSIDILTAFPEIVQFAQAFTKEQAANHYLEYFILASMLASPIRNGVHTTPLFVSLEQCGESVFRSWSDIRDSEEERIAVTLAHTYMPKKAPYNIGSVTPYPKYIIPELGGKTYEDIDISFHLPDNFALTPQTFQFTPNPIMAVAKPISMTGVCLSDFINVMYSLSIPVIVRAHDPITGNIFQFSNQLTIRDNVPVPLADAGITGAGLQAKTCADTQCSADIQVASLSGSPVQGADITFMGCSIGQTSSSGRLQEGVPCGIGPLVVTKQGHAVSSRMHSSEELASLAVTLPETLTTTLHISQVNLVDTASTYTADAIAPLLPKDRRVMLTLSSPEGAYTQVVDNAGSLAAVPAGTYVILAQLLSDDFQTSYGQVEVVQTLSEGLNDLYLYLPFNVQFSQLSQSGDSQTMTDLGLNFTSFLQACGIGPVSPTPADQSAIPCSKPKSDV